MKKFLLLLIVLLLSLVGVSASGVDWNATAVFYIPLFNHSVGSSGLEDLSGNGFNGTAVNGVTFNGDLSAFDFNGVNEYVNSTYNSPNNFFNNPFTASAWLRAGSDGEAYYLGSTDEQGAVDAIIYFQLDESGSNTADSRFRGGGGTNLDTVSGTTNIMGGGLFHIMTIYDGTNISLYINNSLEGTIVATIDGNVANPTDALFIGALNNRGNPAGYFDGELSALTILNISANSTQRNEIFVGGKNYNPFDPVPPVPPSNVSQVLENTVKIDQPGLVSVGATSYATIVNGSFTVDNTTSAITSWTVHVHNRLVTDVACRVLLDGVDYNSEINRSFSGTFEQGNIFSYSTNSSVSAGTHWAALQCRKIAGSSFFEVVDSIGIVHLLHDEDGENITFVSQSFRNITLNQSVYYELGSINFTTFAADTDIFNISLVFEGAINYRYVSEANISFFATVSGVDTPGYVRYGSASSDGSGGGLYIATPVPSNTTVEFVLYGRSSSGDGGADINMVIKQFINDIGETNVSLVTGASINNSWAIIEELTINNSDHIAANIVVKSVNSYVSNSGTQTLSLMLGNDAVNSSVFERTIAEARPGVVVLQDVFQNIGVGVHNIYVWGMVSGTNATLFNGSSIAYLTDNVAFSSLRYEVRAFDDWDNSSISVFNVTNEDGITFTTTVGVVNVTPSGLTDTINITSNDHFSRVVVGHNVTLDLNVTLNQSVISFNASEIHSGALLANVTFYVTNGTLSASTDDGLGLKAGAYNVTAVKNGFFNKTVLFNVFALDVKTVSVDDMFTTLLTVKTVDIISNSTINGSNITLSLGVFSQSYVNVSEGLFNVSSRLNYSLVADAANHAELVENVSGFGNGSVTYLARMYAYNSLWTRAFSQIGLGNISNFTVTVQNAFNQYENSTTDGRVEINDILSGIYSVTVSADNFSTATYTVTMADNSHQNLNAYLNPVVGNTFSFTIKDQSTSSLLEGALITQKKWLNGSQLVIESELSSVVGSASFTFEDDVKYTFIVSKAGYVSRTFELIIEAESYTILMQKSQVVNESVYTDDVLMVLQDYLFVSDSETSFITIDFSSASGVLDDYFINVTILGNTSYVSGTNPFGEVLNATINISGASLGDEVVVTYGYKATVNSGVKQFSRVFLITDWTDRVNTLQNSRHWFDKHGFLEKALIGTLIVFVITSLFVSASLFTGGLSFTSGAFGALLAFLLTGWLGLFTAEVVIVVTFVLGIVIVNGMGGER